MPGEIAQRAKPQKGRHFAGRIPPAAIIGAVAVIVIASILATNIIFLRDLRQSALKDAEASLLRHSVTLADQADISFKSLDLVLSSVEDDLRQQGGLTDAASYRRIAADHATQLLLKEKITGLPEVEAVSLIDADGELINFSRFWPAPSVDVHDRDYFQALKANPGLESFISKPVRNRVTASWNIFLARRLSDPNGQFIGLLFGAISLQDLENFFDATTLGVGSSVALMREDGMVLAGNPHPENIGDIVTSEGWQQLAAHDSGVARRTDAASGRMEILAPHKLANYPMFMLAALDEDAALSGWWRLAELLGAMTVASIGIVSVAAIVAGRLWAQQATLVHFRAEKAEGEAELARRDRFSNLGQLTASIAHELRNPFSTIRNSLHLIQETTEKHAVDIERPLSRIARCIQRCERMLDGLVEYSAAGAPARRATRLDIWLGEVLDDQKLSDSVAVRRDFGAPDGIVDLDTKRFRVVIANVLENAAQAIEADSTPLSSPVIPPLIPHVIKVTTRATDTLAIRIEDDGCGMPPEILARVFEPLFSTKSFGTGLGLSTVKQVVEQHGGTIAIETKLGRGTTVVIVLPLLAHQRAAA